MSSRTTFLLVLAVLALGAFTWFVDGRRDSPSRAENAALKLFPSLAPRAVTAMEVLLTNGLIRAERLNNGWQLRTPRSASQQTGFDALVEFIAGLTNLTYLPPSEVGLDTNASSGFGFSPPRAAVRVELGTNLIEFQVGARTLLRDEIYLKLKNDRGVYVADAKLLEYLPRNPDEWRDPRVVAIRRDEFDSITLVPGTAPPLSLRFDPASASWSMDRPVKGTRVDLREAERLLLKIDDLRVQRFVSEDPKADLDQYGLMERSLELRFMKNTNLVLQVRFGRSGVPDSSQLFAISSLYSNIVSVAAPAVAALRVNPNDLRERTLLLFDDSKVERIEVKSRTESFALQRTMSPRGWQYSTPAAGVDPELVAAFLKRLAGLNVAAWESDSVTSFTPYGLETPGVRYILYSSPTNQSGPTDAILASVSFSTNRLMPTRPDLVYARRGTNENSVFGISLFDLNALPKSSFEFRDRQIWNFSVSNVLGAQVTFEGRTNLLSRISTNTWVSDPLKNSAIEEAFVRLGGLRAENWVVPDDALFRSLFPEPRSEIHIEVVSGGKTNLQQLVIGTRSLDTSGRPYASIVSGEGTRLIFKLSASLWEDWIKWMLP